MPCHLNKKSWVHPFIRKTCQTHIAPWEWFGHHCGPSMYSKSKSYPILILTEYCFGKSIHFDVLIEKKVIKAGSYPRAVVFYSQDLIFGTKF